MASRAIVRRGRFCILAWFFSNNHLEDCGLLCLNQSVRNEIAERGYECVCCSFRFNELDADREVPALRFAPLSRMRPMMRSESGCRANQLCPCHSALT